MSAAALLCGLVALIRSYIASCNRNDGQQPLLQQQLLVCIAEKEDKLFCPRCRRWNGWRATRCRCGAPVPRSPGLQAAPAEPPRRGGPRGFPKGGLDRIDKGCVLAGAMREWLEETGIPLARLRPLPGRFVDDGRTGARLVVAVCEPGAGPNAALGATAGGEGQCWPRTWVGFGNPCSALVFQFAFKFDFGPDARFEQRLNAPGEHITLA